MNSKLETVGALIHQFRTDDVALINYVHQLPKLFGMYLGDPDCVKLCSVTGSFSFDRPPHDTNNVTEGFGLLVRVPIGDDNINYNLVRLCLTVRGTTNGDVTLDRMRLCGGSRSSSNGAGEVCVFLFEYLVDLVTKQISNDMRFVTTINDIPS